MGKTFEQPRTDGSEQRRLFVWKMTTCLLVGVRECPLAQKSWNVALVLENFLPTDAKVILSILIPQRVVNDKIVWAGAYTSIYSAKEGYKFWFNQNCSSLFTTQCQGWKRLWVLLIPYKVKNFIRMFYRNTIPVRWRLSAKGVLLLITCPMCSTDVEHLLHVFLIANLHLSGAVLACIMT